MILRHSPKNTTLPKIAYLCRVVERIQMIDESTKYELQNIIEGYGLSGTTTLIKTVQRFLRENESTSQEHSQSKSFKKQEKDKLIKIS